MLGGAADNAAVKLDGIFRDNVRYNFAPRFTRVSLSTGDMVLLSAGGSFVPLTGSATLSFVDGTVIDVSAGRTVSSGTRLTQNRRYFCVEDTVAIITANSASAGQVDGFYNIETAVPRLPHPVFKDIMDNDWYYSAVDFVYSRNLFGGTLPNTFSPGVPMTRGMFVTVLHRLDGRPNAGSGGQFPDVRDASHYYYNAVTWANANNIVRGYSDGTFRPNESITREQMAAIIYRYAEYKRLDLSATESTYITFPDRTDVSSYAADAMRWAVSKGVINGSNGKLMPKSTATRAQVAQIIFNYIKLSE